MTPHLSLFAVIALILAPAVLCIPPVPSVLLQNAAAPNTHMPAVGLGTGGYGDENGTGGEYWDSAQGHDAVLMWLKSGGVRIDSSGDYDSQEGVGSGWVASGVPRSSIFITSKVNPHGYNETLDEIEEILSTLNTTYVDLLLIHWPGNQPGASNPVTPPCAADESTWTQCRVQTWKALEAIYKQKKARAIGVSNYEVNHLLEIFALGSSIPSVNQVEFHPYWHEDELLDFCQQHNILFNSYSPIGAPDHAAWLGSDWNPKPDLRLHPDVIEISQKHNKTPAQVIMRWHWQQGIVINPRTRSQQHMIDNLSIFEPDFELDTHDMEVLSYLNHPVISKVCGDPRLIL